MFIPFLSAIKPAAPAVHATDAEDIEVDLELQQALAESMAAPSPGRGLHSKGNVLRDISNWRLPIKSSKPAAVRKQSPPLAALQTGMQVHQCAASVYELRGHCFNTPLY